MFGASASVLVVEVVALRLLAPYLGLTLETSTLVIGVALAAIAMGSWAGGRAADVMSPRRALGPAAGRSGVAVAATPFAVRGAAAIGGTLLLTTGGGAVDHRAGHAARRHHPDGHQDPADQPRPRPAPWSASCPGIGTAGAIVGTVVTGFVLISRVPVSGIMVGLGIALLVGAAAVEVRGRAAGGRWRCPALLVAARRRRRRSRAQGAATWRRPITARS